MTFTPYANVVYFFKFFQERYVKIEILSNNFDKTIIFIGFLKIVLLCYLRYAINI